uniref:Dystrophin n=1 Tax=Panagrellus redivivus TaxID=6233 RepID=A0A7E4VBK6_PANRE
MRKLAKQKRRMIRYNMVLTTMKSIQGWDLDTFLSYPPEQRDEIIKALNDDVNKLLSELDPNDPLALRLKDELRRTNDHFLDLLNQSLRGPEPDLSNQFDQSIADLLKKLEEAWKKLNERAGEPVPRNLDDLERLVNDHRAFEDALQGLDVDVSNVKELFRQLPEPTPQQRANHDYLNSRWEDIWDLSRMYVERLKILQQVLQGIAEVQDIVKRHEVTLSSFDDMPAALDQLRGVHSQLLELNMVLQQQENIIQSLNKSVALLRQHVARTRFNVPHHPDVDQLEEQVSQLTVRWDNVCSQVADRLKTAEDSQQTQMVYRSQYDEEIQWLDRVEATINALRRPETLQPHELQSQLDQLISEYAQLQEHTATIENINKEGGKFIREAKNYDNRLDVFRENIAGIHGPAVRSEFRRTQPQPKNGAQIVTEELEALNRRFAQLSSVILERRNQLGVLIQNWKRKQQEEEERRRAEEEAKRRAFEEARKRALEEADRLRKEREAAEAARRAAEEADRARREREAAEAARRAAEDAERRRRQREADDAARRAAEEEAERLRRQREADDAARRAAEEEAERRRREDEERRRREEEERRRREEEDRRRRDDEDRRRREEEERRRREEEDRIRLQPKEPVLNIAQGLHEGFATDDIDEFDTLGDAPDRAKITEHEDEMEMYQEETVTKTQFYEMEGVLHKQTGEILTFVEAIRQGLLDLSSGGGQFFDIVSGARISLEKAAELGYINEDVNQILNTHYGIRHPETGVDITLLEAIQIGLYDPDNRQLRDIHSGEILSLLESRHVCDLDTQRKLIKQGILKLPPLSLEHAIAQGVVNTQTGEFTGKFTREVMSLQDALYNGYINLGSQNVTTIAAPLSDVIEDGFINGQTAEFVDRNSDDKFTLRQALARDNKLINDNVREVINTQKNERITLADAIISHAINHKVGKFVDLATRGELTLRQAYDKGYISKPLTLTEAAERDLVDTANRFVDRGTQSRYTLLEAIAKGVIDPDVRHIVDPDEEEIISISEALERGLLDSAGHLNLVKQQRTINLTEGISEGLLTKRARHTIFNVKGIKNTQTGLNLSFNEAVELGALIVPAERVVDLSNNQGSLLTDASDKIVDPMLKELLTGPIGIRESGQELTLIRAVAKGYIDPVKGVLIDQRSNRELTPKEAYNTGLVTLRGALKLAGLFDVHASLMTPIKKRDQKRRVLRPGQPQQQILGEDQVRVTLADAMKQGLIDSRTQRFRQGDQEMSLHDALSQGLIDPSSEWIIPNRNSQVGPTIEEKTQESVTETGQQLAPKIYPDKQLEETVSTVKRVRRTETSAVGGPGGVSVYRAITGSKGAIEVPADGYHIREAARRGIVDLATGVVSPPGTDKRLSLEEAITLGVLNPKSLSFREPKSGRTLNASEAIDQKIIDRHGNLEVDGRKVTLQEAVDRHLVHLEAEPPAHISDSNKKVIQFSAGHGPVMSFRPVGQAVVEEHETSWSFDSSVGELVDLGSGERLPIEAALRSGRLTKDDLRVRDALTGREMTFDEAEKWGIIDILSGYYLDKSTNQRISFSEAARQHRIYPTGGVPENAGDAVHTTFKIQTRSQVAKKEALTAGPSHGDDFNIGQLVRSNRFDPSSGRFALPDAPNDLTLKEIIVKGFLNPYATTVVDRRNNRELKLLDAIEEHIVDDTNGTVKDTATGREYNFAQAISEGLIKEESRDALEVQAITSGVLDNAGYRPQSATSPRLVEQKLQLTPFLAQENYRSEPETSTSSFVRNQVAVMERRGTGGDVERLVDLGAGNQVMVKVIRGEDGVEKGEYIDPTTGMKFTIQLHGDPFVTQTTTKVKSTSQVQSVDLEPHAQFVGIDKVKDMRTGRVMSLQDAQRMGLARVDKKGKQNTKSYSVFRSNIQLAINSGVVDKDGEKISLEDAINTRVVDIENLKYIHPKTNEPLDLSRAANMGLIDVTLAETLPKGICHPANGEKISVKKAIDIGIVNPRTGAVRNPFTNEKLTWIDLVKSVYNSLTMEGVYDPSKGYGVPILHALHDGLIDSKTEQYYNAITGDRFSLADAASKGLIDQETFRVLSAPAITDYRTRRELNLIQAVANKIIDPKNRTVQLSDNKIVPITKAIEEGAISREVADRLRRIEKLTFAEALGKGLIDVVQDTFTDPDSGKTLTISEAVNQGLLDTGDVNNDDDKNLSRVLSSDIFDERSGRIRDANTGLHLTFRAAVDQGVIDPDSLLHDIESSQTVTIREAIKKGLVDNDGKYIDPKTHNKITLNEAARSGLVAVISSPMQLAQAVTEAVKRREAEGFKFKIESIDDSGKRESVPKFRDEQTIIRLTPSRVQPGLSSRIRSSVTEDPRNSRRSIVDDALELADLQHEYLDKLDKAGVSVDDKVLENPATMQNVSIREAVETGLLDVVNHAIVHPSSGRQYSLPKAAHMRLLNPDTARKLLETLDLPLDELNQLIPPPGSSAPGVSSSSTYHTTSSSTFSEIPATSSQFHHATVVEEPRKSWTKEVNWSGNPAELRQPGGDSRLSTFTTTSPDGKTTTTTRTSSYSFKSDNQ